MRHFFGLAGVPPAVAAVGVGAGLGAVFVAYVILEFQQTGEMGGDLAANAVALAPQAQKHRQ